MPDDQIICAMCAQVHTKCTGHPHADSDGNYRPCGNDPMANGKCKDHGGKTPKGWLSPHTTHGKRSVYLNDVKGKRKRLLEQATPLKTALPDVTDEIGVEKMRLHELLQTLDAATLAECWNQIMNHWGELQLLLDTDPADIPVGDDMRDPEDVLKDLIKAERDTLNRVFRTVAGNERTYGKITETTDKIRKLQETNAKLRAANREELKDLQVFVPISFLWNFLDAAGAVLHQSPPDIRERQLSDMRALMDQLPEHVKNPIVRGE